MTHHVARFLACVLSLGAAVAPLAAQTARPDTDARARTRPIWRVGVEAGSAHEQGVRFIGDGDNDTFHRVGGVVSGGLASARWRAELDARGEVVRFVTLRDLDRETWDFGTTLSYRVTPRLQAQLAVRALTSNMPLGIAQLEPTVLPLLISRTQAGVMTLAGRVGARSELVLAIDGTRVRFDAPGFAGGHTGGALLRFTTRSRAENAVGAQLDVRRANFDSVGVTTALFEGDLTRALGRTTSLRLRAGLTATGSVDSSGGARVDPTGSFELIQPLQRVTLRALASRSVQAAFGFGRVFRTETAGLSAEYGRFGGRIVRLAADASRNVDPFDPDLTFSFTSLTGEVTQPIGSRLALVAGAFVRRIEQVVPIANSGVTVSARFDTSR